MINLPADAQVDPYWYSATDLPGLDFNRDIVLPGTNTTFPNGALGIRADDDFWAVAALPYRYVNEDFREILNALWPDYKDQLTITPDSGSVEQKIYATNQYARAQRERSEHMEKLVFELSRELSRFRIKKPDLVFKPRSKHRSESDYFIQQYEHLLTAMAHEAVPCPDPMKGVCSICDLYCSDRVHSKRYIEKKAKGFDRSFKIQCDLPDDDRTNGFLED